MFCTSQNQGPIPVFSLRFYFISMAGGFDVHRCWIVLINVCNLAPDNCRTQNQMLFLKMWNSVFKLQRNISQRWIGAVSPASPHIYKSLSFIFKCWSTFGAGWILFRITVVFFFFKGRGLGFLHTQALGSEEQWEFICRWGTTFSSPICLIEDYLLWEVYGLCRLATTLPLLRVAGGCSA